MGGGVVAFIPPPLHLLTFVSFVLSFFANHLRSFVGCVQTDVLHLLWRPRFLLLLAHICVRHARGPYGRRKRQPKRTHHQTVQKLNNGRLYVSNIHIYGEIYSFLSCSKRQQTTTTLLLHHYTRPSSPSAPRRSTTRHDRRITL